MQVSLTLYADQLLQRMMSLGYRDPAQAILPMERLRQRGCLRAHGTIRNR